MIMYSLLPLLALIAPLFVGALCIFTYPFVFLESFFRKIEKIVLLLGTTLTLLIILSMIPYILAGQTLETPVFSLRVDSINIAGAIGVALISFLASIYNVRAERGGRLKPNVYNFFILLFLVCMLGLLFSYDLFGIFLFVELTIGVSIVLVIHAPGKLSPEAAFKYLIITAISALFVLLAVLMVFVITHNSNILVMLDNSAQLLENPRLIALVVVCFVIGLGADIGLVPFHGWVPDVLPASTPIINVFFTAEPIAFTLALYKLIYPFYTIYPSQSFIWILSGLGFISVVFGVLLAYPQRDFYRMFAYCSIEEFGHMILPLALFTPLGLTAGQFYIVNVSLMKAGLVACLGSVFINTGTRNMDSLGGLVGSMRTTALSYIICALSIAGVPPLSGFYAKLLIYTAIYEFMLQKAGLFASVLTVIFLACISIVSLVYLMRSFHMIFLGEPTEILRGLRDVPFLMWLPTVIISGLALLLGVQPNILLSIAK
jgi:multicomponent Na+:H+ antiporter subunit D